MPYYDSEIDEEAFGGDLEPEPGEWEYPDDDDLLDELYYGDGEWDDATWD
jgi:hypothetical protein